MLRNARMTLAGVFVAAACGAVTVGITWATPSTGLTTTIVAGPTLLGPTRVSSESEINEVEFNTKGISHVYVVHNRIAPGGHTGWHSHPGPSIVSVVSGTATNYREDDPDGTIYQAGSAFVDEGGDHAHIVVNEGTTDLVLVAFQILPLGATRRIDEPAPF
jgi:quercetin dioxygenase-like cupin family protein